ncbi:MAG: glutamate--tRNA ligase [Deltaproteobacteria bacterium]|nr:glutamate--tRNA ligase [Deltaproteobacteria bacterium]MBW1914798.1 glutamate--tRNA ligase [Deltaproteobacteria bacterium]
MDERVIVRFAPSPTGYLHIGGARTAIYNWLYAKKMGGKFILRIEDTDAERSTQESIMGILDGLKWLGIEWDVGPYFQSEYIEEHKTAAQKLLDSGAAYKCFCTKEKLDQKREQARQEKRDTKYDGTCRDLTPEQIAGKETRELPFVIRLKVPQDGGSVTFEDKVYGFIEKRHEDIEDFVIVRSNGQPLYVLSNTVDDIHDGITHILRGQDGLANTPKQILIYRALNAKIPQFSHMSLTLDTKKAKISKRKHGEIVAVDFYRKHGFLPWAFVNFLVLLGWSTSESTQIFTKDELIEAFSFEGLNKSNSIFDVRKDDPKFFTDPKAISINSHYIRNLPIEDIFPFVKMELKKAGKWDTSFDGDKREWFLNTMDLIRSRFNFTTDFVTLGRAYFSNDFPINEKALKKNILKHKTLKDWFPMLANTLEAVKIFNLETSEQVIRDLAEKHEIKAGILINGIRTAVTGQAVGPGLFDVLVAIGQERVVARLRKATDYFE